MSEKKDIQKKEPLAYVKIFISIVLVIIAVSMVIKIGNLYTKRNFVSTSFTFLVLEKDAYIVRVDKENHTISVARITGVDDRFFSASRISQEIYLGVPIEGSLVYKNRPPDDNFNNTFFSFPHIMELLLRRDKISYHNINPVDIISVYLAARGAQETDTQTFSVKDFSPTVFLKNGMDKKMADLFRDSAIFNEATSIEVDNTTSITGLGSMVAGMLKNVGYNVVFVTSAQPVDHTVIINRGSKNTTIHKLSHILQAPIVQSTQSAQTEVSIIIGNDFLYKGL